MLRPSLRLLRGILGMPPPWRLWVGLLVAANLVAPLYFLAHTEARVVLGTFVVAALLMTLLTALAGFTRLLGLAHFVWFPLLWYLATRLPAHPASEPLGLWLRAVLLVDAVSLAIDVTDVIRYLRGERAEQA